MDLTHPDLAHPDIAHPDIAHPDIAHLDIARVRAGALDPARIVTFIDEVLEFDARENAASGLGPDFDPLPSRVRQEFLTATEYTTREFWVGRLGGEIVARGIAHLSLHDNVDQAEIWLAVDPRLRRCGLGTALLERMEADLAADGRTQLRSFNEIAVAACASERRSPHLAAASGAGSLPAALPAVEFLSRRGFALQQVERCSRAETAVATQIDIGRLAAAYAVVTWTGATPEEHLDGMADLHQRMSTDAPGAAELMEEETWDADRVRQLDAERIGAGETMHTALALCGREAVGFTEVSEPTDRTEAGWQGATLVAAEHRGHRLGAHLKIANHRALAQRSAVRRVYTWNAVENSWMLAINGLAGFVTHAWTGLWTKRLA
ncbi:GNAT family N-acetyltransferase [Brevibacterium sp.]|uniref:GNAT family N-acetyltransferase n=1 Tax=Brevibacterium sp. TaxID=1701 RepID=UPI00281214A8|nr:GNAT family N-acetyltransferase [Brevibacterium sp.]